MKRWLPPVSGRHLLEEQGVNLSFVTVILIVGTVAALAPPILIAVAGVGQISGQNQLKRFSSYEELENFVMTNAGNYREYYYDSSLSNQSFFTRIRWAPSGGMLSVAVSEGHDDYVKYTINGGSESQVDYSTTNIQVEGVDEADIVKSDGKYIYVVSGNRVIIIDAYPAENARVLSKIEAGAHLTELFINGNKLAVLGWENIKVYDVSDKENPLLTRDVSFDGYYFDSRMVGDYVYVIINSPAIYREAGKINLPCISSNGNTKTVPATEIYYFENIEDYSYGFTTIMAINVQDDDEEITSETFLIGTTQNIFVSSNNIYITYTNYWAYPLIDWSSKISDQEILEKTTIHKISITDGKIEYKTQGEVPGHVLNQFSMDEYQGYFRIATTTGEVWGGGAQNHVYVLDEDLNIIGRLEGIAPGERIYSARFMGDRAYLVTFKKVDPLFVIDLRDPRDPKVLGELKIPGYSDYLHPYDENHIIGVGKDTVDAGSFAWYQGVKIALFDVSDPQNPIEISKYVIGERGSDSYALRDHRAFLFSRSKNLLVIPISLVEDGGSSWWYGGYNWQGAYVFNVTLDGGFVLRGGITHSNYSVKRSLYIDNVLYTISDGLVKMNNLEDLSEISEIELGYIETPLPRITISQFSS